MPFFISGVCSAVPITIELPDLKSQTAFNLARWAEILADPRLAKLPERIETDRHGHILMTPQIIAALDCLRHVPILDFAQNRFPASATDFVPLPVSRIFMTSKVIEQLKCNATQFGSSACKMR
jgi:hypothetical protein